MQRDMRKAIRTIEEMYACNRCVKWLIERRGISIICLICISTMRLKIIPKDLLLIGDAKRGFIFYTVGAAGEN